VDTLLEGLGSGPIRRVHRVLENAGVVVAHVDDDALQIDAFSCFGQNDPRIVALGMAKGSASRAIFDSAVQDAMTELVNAMIRTSLITRRNARLADSPVPSCCLAHRFHASSGPLAGPAWDISSS